MMEAFVQNNSLTLKQRQQYKVALAEMFVVRASVTFELSSVHLEVSQRSQVKL